MTVEDPGINEKEVHKCAHNGELITEILAVQVTSIVNIFRSYHIKYVRVQ